MAASTASIVSAVTWTGRPRQSAYSVMTPWACASSTSGPVGDVTARVCQHSRRPPTRAGDRNRTRGISLTRRTLYQLSYTGMCAAHRSCESRFGPIPFRLRAPGVDPTRGHGGLRGSGPEGTGTVADYYYTMGTDSLNGMRDAAIESTMHLLGNGGSVSGGLRRRQPTGADHATGRSLRGQHLRQRRPGDRPDRAVRSLVLHRPGVALPRPALDGRVLRQPDRRALPGLVAHPPGPATSKAWSTSAE